MKREQVKVGMVVYSRVTGEYREVAGKPFKAVSGAMYADLWINLRKIPAFVGDLRPLTARERGE